MDAVFTADDSFALFGLLSENHSDILIKSDCRGNILHASSPSRTSGRCWASGLPGRHLADIVQPRHASAILQRHTDAAAGKTAEYWEPFAAPMPDGGERWFEIRMRGVPGERDPIAGVLSVLRSIDNNDRRERKILDIAEIDQLTGLANRKAFTSVLDRLLTEKHQGWLAVFELDHFKSINIRHGQSAGDEALIAFSHYLRTAMRKQDFFARISGKSFGVLLPGLTAGEVEATCERIVTGIADRKIVNDTISVTTSAGLARIAGSVDNTFQRVDVALTLAKAKGRNRFEVEHSQERFDWVLPFGSMRNTFD